MTDPDLQTRHSLEALTGLRHSLVSQLQHAFGPGRGGLRHDLWVVEKALGLHQGYFSHSGQDRFVSETLLKGRTGGVFLELGGYDGVTGSNSLFFERELGWSGLLIEPSAAKFAEAAAVRNCTCLNHAVGDPALAADFLNIRSGYMQSSGLMTSIDPQILSDLRRHPEHEERIERIPVRSIRDILAEAGIDHIDYLSLDVEGGERAILETFPFETVTVDTWSIENLADSPEIPAFMAARGFEVVEFIGVDEIYKAT